MPGELGSGESFPSAIVLQCKDPEAGVVRARHFLEVVGLEMILTVAGETESVDFDGFGKVDFDPRLLFGVLSGGRSPDHRAIFAIVGFFNGRAFLKHFRRFDEGRSGVLLSEIFTEVSGAEDFEFIDKDFR